MKSPRTTVFLMANLGTEILRLFGYKNKGDLADARMSAERASRIIDSLERHPDINSGKKEVDMIRKVMVEDALSDRPEYHITEADVSSYFMPFSMRALAESGIA